VYSVHPYFLLGIILFFKEYYYIKIKKEGETMITKETLEKMKLDLNDYFTGFEETHKVKVEMGNISFDDLSFTFRINVTMKEVQSIKDERQFFKERCTAFGLHPTDYLHEFRMQMKSGEKAEVFEITGFDLTNDAKPIKARSIKTGDTYNFGMEVVEDIHQQDMKMVSNKVKEPPKLIQRNKK
jgi:hypothetical protein